MTKDCNVGIAMPTRSLERWINDGEGLQALLKADGCTVDLQYADNKTDQQISQLQNMIANGAKILVIASIDGTTLGPVLADAGAAGATVIAYDRLIIGSPNVDYYATFDNYLVGQLQGKFIESKLGLADGKGPFNFEPFAGSPDDNNAKFFFAGAWDVLCQYVDSGQLVIKSGKAPKPTTDEWQSIGILGWGTDDAQAEMETASARSTPARRWTSSSPRTTRSLRVLPPRLTAPATPRAPRPHGPGRRQGERCQHARWQAVHDGLEGHPRARQARPHDDPGRSSRATPSRSTTPRRTTTATTSSRRTSCCRRLSRRIRSSPS